MAHTVQCRLAAPEDAADLAETHVSAWQTAYAGHMPAEFLDSLDVADSKRRWDERLARHDADIFVAEVASATGAPDVVGFCTVGPSRDADATTQLGEIQAINLHPRAWRQGVGRALLGHACQNLRNRGFREAMLWVLEANARARAFYEACGWNLDPPPEGRKVVDQIANVDLPHLRYRRTL